VSVKTGVTLGAPVAVGTGVAVETGGNVAVAVAAGGDVGVGDGDAADPPPPPQPARERSSTAAKVTVFVARIRRTIRPHQLAQMLALLPPATLRGPCPPACSRPRRRDGWRGGGISATLPAMFDLVLAIALLGLAGAILWYVGALVLQAAGLPLGRSLVRLRVARHVAHARNADRLIAAGERDAALARIRRAFFLGTVTDAGLLAEVANHHTGLLSRMLALTSEHGAGGVRLLSLAKVDRLLTERATLQRRLLQLRRNGSRQAATEAAARVDTNTADLAHALDQLAAEIAALPSGPRLH
jgi:hypothetical protein